jgi:excinuclease ABC subunit B
VGEPGNEDVTAVIAELEDEMTEASGKLEFERAALLRDQINALRTGDYKKLARSAKGTRYPQPKKGRKG